MNGCGVSNNDFCELVGNFNKLTEKVENLVDKVNETYHTALNLEKIVMGLDVSIRGNGTRGLSDRVKDLEKKKPFPWMMACRMTMASFVTVAAMVAVVKMPTPPQSITYMMYGGGAFLFGDSLFTMLKKKL